MALADSITALGTAIINLVGTRLNRDANNFSTAGTQNLNNMIDSRIGAVTGAPVGTVIAYMGTDEPEGFLLMDGRELSRTTYAALFAVIGTSQGAGDGSTTFNIADMTDGRYLMGSTVAGTSVEAGIPDTRWGVITRLSINTSSRYIMWTRTGYGVTVSLITSNETAPFQGVQPTDTKQAQYTWLASSIDSIYGNSSTVTPDSCSVKFFIRY